ncbi:MAG: tRNA (adenosine(37)-N6)-threonylcarbamoyltransferase complex dimerization subunit type 1 TsaB [Gammaproteobacteria bacterium]
MSLKILAIDTSTDACSAALLIDNETSERFEIAPRQHTELILPMVESLLAEADIALKDLDVIAFGRGPGAFTGLRIAAGVTQGLAYGAELKVIPVSSLAAMAHGAWKKTGCQTIIAANDARMNEVYWGVYRFSTDHSIYQLCAETVCAPGEVPIPADTGWIGVGSAWESFQLVLGHVLSRCLLRWEEGYFPHASDVAILAIDELKQGNVVSPELALPVYLRDNVAQPNPGKT